MRTSISCLAIATTLLWAFAASGQSTSQAPTLTNLKAQPPSRTTLLARSDMQSPKPIPIIRPLRFREIPAGFKVNGAEPRAIDVQSTVGEQSVEVQSENGVVNGREADSAPKFP